MRANAEGVKGKNFALSVLQAVMKPTDAAGYYGERVVLSAVTYGTRNGMGRRGSWDKAGFGRCCDISDELYLGIGYQEGICSLWRLKLSG